LSRPFGARSDSVPQASTIQCAKPPVIEVGPDLDGTEFDDAISKAKSFTGSIILQAWLNADGTVSDVSPTTTLRTEETETSLESKESGPLTPFIFNAEFVETLP
jgi:hypothetical protein